MFIVPDNWGPTLKEAVQKEELKIIPYKLKLDYDYWSYRMRAKPPSSWYISTNAMLQMM